MLNALFVTVRSERDRSAATLASKFKGIEVLTSKISSRELEAKREREFQLPSIVIKI